MNGLIVPQHRVDFHKTTAVPNDIGVPLRWHHYVSIEHPTHPWVPHCWYRGGRFNRRWCSMFFQQHEGSIWHSVRSFKKTFLVVELCNVLFPHKSGVLPFMVSHPRLYKRRCHGSCCLYLIVFIIIRQQMRKDILLFWCILVTLIVWRGVHDLEFTHGHITSSLCQSDNRLKVLDVKKGRFEIEWAHQTLPSAFFLPIVALFSPLLICLIASCLRQHWLAHHHSLFKILYGIMDDEKAHTHARTC